MRTGLNYPRGFSVVDQIVTLLLVDAPIGGSTQKEQAHQQGLKTGRNNGLIECLALVLTEKRAEAYPLWDFTPAVDTHELRNLFRVSSNPDEAGGIRKAKWRLDEQMGNIRKQDGDVKELRKQYEEEFDREVNRLLVKLTMLDEQDHEQYETDRRAKVREGELDPLPTDVEWLTEEAGEFSDQQRRINALIKKAEASK